MSKINPFQIRSVLLVSFSNIGDAVLSLPVLDVLAETLPNASIDVVAGAHARMIFESDARVRRVWESSRKSLGERWKLFCDIRDSKYDLVVDLRKTYFSILGRHRVSAFGKPTGIHRRDAHLAVLEGLGLPVESSRQEAKSKRIAETMTTRLIVIAPGSKSHIKKWGDAKFARLADELITDGAYEVVWIGDERERGEIEKIQSLMRSRTQNLAGRVSWAESVELIKKSALVITNDSAPLHAADHYSKKVLAFFGPTDARKYGPQETRAGVMQRGTFCSPCERPQCRYRHECMEEISVVSALKRARELLSDDEKNSVENILIVRLDRVGDLLLSFPAIASVRARFPRSRITLVVRPYVRDIAERCSYVDEVIAYDYGKGGRHRSLIGYLRFVRELRRRKFKSVFVLHPTLRSHLLAYLSDIPCRVGYAARGAFLLTHRVVDERHAGVQHESRNVLDVVRAFRVPPSDELTTLELFDDDIRTSEELLGERANQEFIAVHPGASSPSKRWPKEHFKDLCLRAQSAGYGVVLLGGKDENEANAWIASHLGENTLNLSGKCTLPVMGAVCRKSAACVMNDSGPAHVASLAGAKVVTIFGRKKTGLGPRRWRPLGENARILQKDVGCVTCLADECTVKFECLNALSPEEVFAALQQTVAA